MVWTWMRGKRALLMALVVACGLTIGAQVEAQTRFYSQNQGLVGIPQAACTKWDMRPNLSFEEAMQDYLRQARVVNETKDFSCMSLASWRVLARLFDAAEESRYDERMKMVAGLYEDAKKNRDSLTQSSLEDLAYLLQHQWLTVMYERLSAYNSQQTAYVAVGAVGAAGTLVGATMLARSPVLRGMRSKAMSVGFKVVQYVGRHTVKNLIQRRMVGAVFGLGGGYMSQRQEQMFAKEPPKAPMDYVDAELGDYTNYTDLAFYRDLGGLMTSSVAGYAAATATDFYFVKAMQLLLGASRVSRVAGKAHIAAAVVSFLVGAAVEKGTEEALTQLYNHRYQERLREMRGELLASVHDDWRTFVAASDLTATLIHWSSLMEVPVTKAVFEGVATFRHNQICSRLLLKSVNEPAITGWERMDVSEETIRDLPSRGEKALRRKISKTASERADRLNMIRTQIIETRRALSSLRKPFVDNLLSQLAALQLRLDRLLAGENELLELEIQATKDGFADFAIGSAKWNDVEFLRGVSKELSCAHPNQDRYHGYAVPGMHGPKANKN
ncbi:MAG: hypothetical protein NDI61_11340 [Bdellovibrionaceae bacterium]|nr:hypothetical protein [Pseudobdellovibrionaceae bacterium]